MQPYVHCSIIYNSQIIETTWQAAVHGLTKSWIQLSDWTVTTTGN